MIDAYECATFIFQPFFVERVFHIFDKDDNGSISLQEFIDAMHQFAGQSPDDKIKFLFKVYDIDGKKTGVEKEREREKGVIYVRGRRRKKPATGPESFYEYEIGGSFFAFTYTLYIQGISGKSDG